MFSPSAAAAVAAASHKAGQIKSFIAQPLLRPLGSGESAGQILQGRRRCQHQKEPEERRA